MKNYLPGWVKTKQLELKKKKKSFNYGYHFREDLVNYTRLEKKADEELSKYPVSRSIFSSKLNHSNIYRHISTEEIYRNGALEVIMHR
jgi:hypothetical protein